eukprot:m.116584 g.116584  ORF g.116584 m.116584 type:complete len:327 (-) comp16081_c1_seq2:1892-2872(-)
MPISAFLSHTQISELQHEKRQIVVLDANASLGFAVTALEERNITAAPVINREVPKSMPWNKRFIGMLDERTTAMFVCQQLATTPVPANTKDFAAQEKALFERTHVKDLLSLSCFGDYLPVDPATHSMLDVCLLLAFFKVHRVFVIQNNEITNIVSSRTVVRWLHDHGGLEIQGVKCKTMLSLGLGMPRETYAVRATQTVWEAFKVLHDHKVSAVPVLDSKDQVVGNVSARDVRSIIKSPSLVAAMEKNLEAWLDDNYMQAVVCHPEDTLRNVLTMLVDNGVNRIYVVQPEDGKLIRMVTTRDILTAILTPPPATYLAKFVQNNPLC